MNQPPPSPPSDAGPAANPVVPVPLDSPTRTTPIHPALPDVRVPGDPLPPHSYDPVSCGAIDFDEVRPQLDQLRREYPTREAVLRAQDEAAKEAKAKIELVEKKRGEIREKIDKKVKERDTEMKVLSKYREVRASDIPS